MKVRPQLFRRLDSSLQELPAWLTLIQKRNQLQRPWELTGLVLPGEAPSYEGEGLLWAASGTRWALGKLHPEIDPSPHSYVPFRSSFFIPLNLNKLLIRK